MKNSKKAHIQEYTHHFAKTIGIQLTLNCPFKCDHCMVNSGPERHEEIPTEKALDWISEIGKNKSIGLISITGGEPFVDLKKLEILTGLTKEYGLLVNVVTNAFWSKSYSYARKILEGLPGITHLSISTDEFHLENVPLENIKNASMAALENGIEVALSICSKHNPDFNDHLKSTLGNELFERLVIITQHIHSVGMAKYLRFPELKKPVKELSPLACGNLSMPFILHDGTVMACCGDIILNPELYDSLCLGNIELTPLNQILREADQNYLIHALRLWGPSGLLKRIPDEKLTPGLKKGYSAGNICDLCSDMLSHSDIVNQLKDELSRKKVQREIALGRSLKYGELSMLKSTEPL